MTVFIGGDCSEKLFRFKLQTVSVKKMYILLNY